MIRTDEGPGPCGQEACRVIDDKEAEAEIRLYLAGARGGGKLRVELLEIVYDLGIPPEQVERVMASLCSEGVKDEPLCALYREG